MKTIIKTYKEYLDKGLIEEDSFQKDVVELLDPVIPLKKNLINRFKGINSPKSMDFSGVYMWGDAGSGKTMLMDMCFQTSTINLKKRIHFQEFMVDVHQRLHKCRNEKGINDPLNFIAKEISDEVKFLCFDEFQVNDIADASILTKLFELMFEGGTFIFSTSNFAPTALYKDGLHRERFLPFIELIETSCMNINLTTKKDYRKNRLQDLKTYFSILGNETEVSINEIFYNLTGGAKLSDRKLLIKGRDLIVKNHAMGCARFNYEDLCCQPLGPEDFLTIAREFDIIFIENIPKIGSEKRNEIKRFISLIDALYDSNRRVVISADGEPEEIYKKGDSAFEFKRCASRLHEMRSNEYIDSSRIY
tara:strand:- start:3349 stop:4434 length:1086 start_codon:yes stop_codon:yes gene_type:complete